MMRTTLVIGIICAMTVPALAQQPEGRDGWEAGGSLVVAARAAAARVIAQEEQQYRRQISTGRVVGGGAVLAFGVYIALPCFGGEGSGLLGEGCSGTSATPYLGGLLIAGGALVLREGLVGRQVPVSPSLQWSVTPGGLRLSW